MMMFAKTFAITLGVVSAKHLVIIHLGHEGSHAFVETLQGYPCTRYYLREEIMGTARALTKFLDGNFTFDETDVSSLSKLERDLPDLKQKAASEEAAGITCPCESRGLLVRVDADDIRKDWCNDPLFKRSDVQVILLARLDLLRSAIADYGRDDPKYQLHPQFFTKNTSDLVHKYDVDILRTSIRRAISRWHKTIDKILALRSCHIYPILSTYEAFADVGLPQDFISSLVPCVNISSFHYDFNHLVTKVHSNDIGDFATNAGEIYDFFEASQYKTFAQLAKDDGLDLAHCEWLWN